MKHKPYYYLKLSDAIYYQDAKSYLEDDFPGIELLELVEVSGWRLGLFSYQGELSLSFRGTKTLRNAAHSLLNQWVDSGDILDQMQQYLSAWHVEYGSIAVFTGHSAGGFWGTRLDPAYPASRIAWNGHKCPKHDFPKILNFRTREDLVSGVLSEEGDYVTLCEGGHSRVEFYRCIHPQTSWSDLLESTPKRSITPLSSPLSKKMDVAVRFLVHKAPLKIGLKA